jgi:serine phosphatase RsbU (regulator of sigma subunit)
MTVLQDDSGHAALLARERAARLQLEEHVRHARLSAAVGMALTSTAPLEEQLATCAQALVDHLDVAFARIWTLDDPRTELVLQASAGLYTHLDGPHGRVPVGRYKIGLIAARQQPHLTNDVGGDPEVSDPEWAAREGMVAFAGYPLILGGRCVGVLALFSRRRLPQSTLEALAAVADAIAVGIQQRRAAAQLARQARQMRSLASTAAQVNTADGLEGILALVTERGREIIGAEQGVASLTNGADWAQSLATVSLSDRYARWRDFETPPDGSGIYAHVCESQQSLRLTQAELEAHPRWRGFSASAATHPPMRGWLAAPLTAPDGSNLGIVQLSDKSCGDFTEEDEAILVQLAEIASAAIHKTLLYEDRARVAAALQRSLLPPSLPSIPDTDVTARYQAGRDDVGGDFYDVFPLRGRTWGVVIGDVRGKGPDAAALTALARHSTRTAAMFHRRPDRVLQAMNEALHDEAEPERFCSAAFLRLTTGRDSLHLDVASGGHPPLLIARTDGTIEAIEPTGPLIGLFPTIKLGHQSVRLHAGEVLVAYTDGITEARRGDRLFGQHGLAEVLATHRAATADRIADAITDAAAAYSDRTEGDDAAVLVVRAR